MSEATLTVVMTIENEVPIVREMRFRVDTARIAMVAVICSVTLLLCLTGDAARLWQQQGEREGHWSPATYRHTLKVQSGTLPSGSELKA